MSPPKAKAQPTRMCVTCRQRRPKRELLRFVRTSPGQVILDQQGKCFGRSAYLCHALSCVEQARRRRLLERHLLSNLADEIWRQLAGTVRLNQDG